VGAADFYYTFGSLRCSGGKWKGGMTSRSHSPIAGTYPWQRKVMSMDLPNPFSMMAPSLKQPLAPRQAILSSQINYRLLFAVEGLGAIAKAYFAPASGLRRLRWR